MTEDQVPKWQTEAEIVFPEGELAVLRTTSYTDDWVVRVVWEAQAGRVEPVEVTILSVEREGLRRTSLLRPTPGRPVTADAIRKLPLGEMIAAGRTEIPGVLDTLKLAKSEVLAAGLDFPEELAADGVTVGKPQRGLELTADDLDDVAKVYRTAWLKGQPVNEAVRNAFHLSKDGAAKRIKKARAAGLLEGIGPKR